MEFGAASAMTSLGTAGPYPAAALTSPVTAAPTPPAITAPAIKFATTTTKLPVAAAAAPMPGTQNKGTTGSENTKKSKEN